MFRTLKILLRVRIYHTRGMYPATLQASFLVVRYCHLIVCDITNGDDWEDLPRMLHFACDKAAALHIHY